MNHPFTRIEGLAPARDALDQATLAKIEEIKRNLMEIVKPTKDEIERVSQVTDKVIETVKSSLKDEGIKFDFIEPQGSTGIKQTQLSGDSDVDLFIGLNESIYQDIGGASQKQRKRKLKDTITRWIKGTITPAVEARLSPEKVLFSYAEHPYLTITVDRIKFDVVFCFNISSGYIRDQGLITAMDRTPLHSKFVREKLSTSQKDDVRLLKAFFKAQHIYGDKSATGRMGFIGYGIELMVHFFGMMENVMANFPALERTPLDVFGRDGRILKKKARFANDTLIIIDPTDKERNVGSSTDPRAYKYAKHVIQQFLNEPSDEFFIIDEIDAPENHDHDLFSVVFENAQEVHYTIVRDKLYKLGNAAKTALEKETTQEPRFGRIEFEILLGKGETQAAMGFSVEHPSISPTFTRRGPRSTDDPKRTRGFLDKHPDATIDDEGYHVIQETREFTNFREGLADFISKNLDITGLTPIGGNEGKIAVETSPREKIGRQALHVLKKMVLPFLE